MIKEELLDIVPLKDRTHGIHVKERMMAGFVKANLPISKLTAIAMDGAVNALVEFWKFQGIIHREQDMSKSLNLNTGDARIIFAELNQGLPADMLLHSTVRWLSKGQVLSRFFQLLDVVRLFAREDKDYPQLSDLEWILDLAFMFDMLYIRFNTFSYSVKSQQAALKTLSMLGSTYICESVFPSMDLF